jgi:hypothetical protein
MTHHDDSGAADLQPVIDMLRAHRPEATALELDAVKQRVRKRVAARPAGRRARSANLMKSRLAILSMLVAGLLTSTTGAGLAIDGFGGNDASVAQYGPSHHGGHHHGSTVLPQGQHESGGAPSGEQLQPARQVETGASGGQLPFTGYLAIPVLLAGVTLLSAGLVLRRRTAAQRR